MDVISYQKAQKAKKAIKQTQDRLGYNGTEQDLDITDVYTNTKERLEELEKKDPEVELLNIVSDASKHTMINLNKHNLRVNSLLNHTRYQLTDMIVDDFLDDSGIDQTKSVNYLYDSLNDLIIIAEGQTQAEVVTIKEELDKTPQMIAVSQVFNEETQGEKEVDFSNGTLTDVEVLDGMIQISSIDGITYSSSGFYESPIIDLGDNIKSLYKVENTLDVPEGAEVYLYTATSTDGVSFSEYFPLNMDDTIASPSERYIRIKAELISAGKEKETVVYDFTEEERDAFQENEMIVFDGEARLKTSFIKNMEVDNSFVGEGTLLRKKIEKSKFLRIEEMEVIE